jgi:hypothetical protein
MCGLIGRKNQGVIDGLGRSAGGEILHGIAVLGRHGRDLLLPSWSAERSGEASRFEFRHDFVNISGIKDQVRIDKARDSMAAPNAML